MKRLFSFLCMIFALTSLAVALPVGLQDEFDQVVFDVRLVGGDEVFFGLVENEEDCVALFYDGGKAELNILTCMADEYMELKKLAYGCKLLIKSVVTKNDYERKNIHGQVLDKIREFGKFKTEDYDTIDSLGFIKISWYETELFSEYVSEKFGQTLNEQVQDSEGIDDMDDLDVGLELEENSDKAEETANDDDDSLFFVEGFDWDSYSKELEDALKDLDDVDWSFLVN